MRAKDIKEAEVEAVCARERAGSGNFGDSLTRAPRLTLADELAPILVPFGIERTSATRFEQVSLGR